MRLRRVKISRKSKFCVVFWPVLSAWFRGNNCAPRLQFGHGWKRWCPKWLAAHVRRFLPVKMVTRRLTGDPRGRSVGPMFHPYRPPRALTLVICWLSRVHIHTTDGVTFGQRLNRKVLNRLASRSFRIRKSFLEKKSQSQYVAYLKAIERDPDFIYDNQTRMQIMLINYY